MMPTGPIILDLIAGELSAEECEMLQHPLVGGVVLFARHYESPLQISELCKAIRLAAAKPMLIAVDQEGGRVQRFKQGFTLLPAMRQLGVFYKENPEQALLTAEVCGWLMAAELFSVGVNFSFAPVLDLDRHNNTVIGDRAFHAEPSVVVELARALIQGMHVIGMPATGKHFPGHGGVTLDSHKIMPVDKRGIAEVQSLDMLSFIPLIQDNTLDAIMPAHILYPQVDDKPVGFSKHWLQTVLRLELKFNGVIISDDLNMEGAAFAGNYAERAQLALDAGCNLVLICNNREGAIQILDNVSIEKYHLKNERVNHMCQWSKSTIDYKSLLRTKEWQEKNNRVVRFVEDAINIKTT
jgi:beta-N-acetylhexosaminidase